MQTTVWHHNSDSIVWIRCVRVHARWTQVRKLCLKNQSWMSFIQKWHWTHQPEWEKKNHFIENVMCVFKWQFLGENHFLILKKNLAITWIHGKLKGNFLLQNWKWISLLLLRMQKRRGEKSAKNVRFWFL